MERCKKKKRIDEHFQTGFLSFDARKGGVLPLFKATDLHSSLSSNFEEASVGSALVGIWISDLPQVGSDEASRPELRNPLVWAACARYILCFADKKRSSCRSDKKTFLLAFFNSQTAKIKYYEVR